ncbi:MAG: MFS transporter [Pseudomonadota bacterium]
MQKQKYTIFVLFMAIMIDALGWGVAFPVLDPVILKNSAHMLSVTTSLASRNLLYELALSIYCIFMFLMSPVLGSLSDKYGRKIILIVSMLGNALGFFISALAIPMHSYTVLLIGRSVAGATAGSIPIAQAGIIDISTEEQKASRLGLVVLGNVLGFILGPVIGGFFMDKAIFGNIIGFQTPFYVSAIMGLIGFFLLLFFKETFVGDKTVKINIFTSFNNIYHAFTNKQTVHYCGVLLCFLFGWGIFFSTMPVLLTERLGWTGSNVGYFIAYIGALYAIVILFVMPKATAKIPLTKIIFTGLVVLFICNILFPTVHNSTTPWIYIILTIAVPFTYVSTVTLLSGQVSAQQQGQIMGVTGSIFALTWGVGPILGGYALKAGFTAPYILVGIFFLLAIIIFSCHKTKAPQN